MMAYIVGLTLASLVATYHINITKIQANSTTQRSTQSFGQSTKSFDIHSNTYAYLFFAPHQCTLVVLQSLKWKDFSYSHLKGVGGFGVCKGVELLVISL